MTTRDTHFAGFAELVWNELYEEHIREQILFGESIDKELMQKRIAERAYDLVGYVLHSLELDRDDIPFQDVYTPEDIPDMREWTEQQEGVSDEKRETV